MRARSLAVALALVAAGCGGGDDAGGDESATSSGSVVGSADGLAELVLPDGVDDDGITVEAIEVEGAAAAYELLPSGTTFDEPAMLTVTDVPAPEGAAIAFVLLQGDDEDDAPEPVDGVETTVNGNGTATVVIPIDHFSSTTIGWGTSPTSFDQPLWSVALDAPATVAPNVPFETTMRFGIQDEFARIPARFGTVARYTRKDATVTGTLTGTNTVPAVVTRTPRDASVGNGITETASLRCIEPGEITLEYVVAWTLEVEFTIFFTSDETFAHTTRLTESLACTAEEATTTSSTTTQGEAAPPIVEIIGINLEVPVTSYAVSTSDDLDVVEVVWRMAGEQCGKPATPWRQEGFTVLWSHADAPPDSCSHTGTDHDVQISVTLTNRAGLSTTCTVSGTETRVINDPPCS